MYICTRYIGSTTRPNLCIRLPFSPPLPYLGHSVTLLLGPCMVGHLLAAQSQLLILKHAAVIINWSSYEHGATTFSEPRAETCNNAPLTQSGIRIP
jgi:hypothetical protein